jgi:hypothetical protein
MSERPIPAHVWRAVLRDQMRREAEASVRLDTEGDVHTCHEECQRPGCVARRAAEHPEARGAS